MVKRVNQLLRDNKLSPKRFQWLFMCFRDTNRADSSAAFIYYLKRIDFNSEILIFLNIYIWLTL